MFIIYAQEGFYLNFTENRYVKQKQVFSRKDLYFQNFNIEFRFLFVCLDRMRAHIF